MADPGEIIEKGEAFTIYRSSRWGPAVPYPGCVEARPDGTQNHGFRDLRLDPSAASQVPEAIGKPGLIALLEAVNNPTSPLRTLGCANWFEVVKEPDPDGPSCFVQSYVHIAFVDPRMGSEENIFNLARRIIKARPPRFSELGDYQLGSERMKHYFGLRDVYCLHLIIIAYATSEPDAWIIYNQHADVTGRVIRDHVAPRVPKTWEAPLASQARLLNRGDAGTVIVLDPDRGEEPR